MRRPLILLALLGALATFATAMRTPAPAVARPAGVIADCNSHDRLTRGYSVSELRGALSAMPADVKEYTNCHDVIERALLAQLGGSHRRAAPAGPRGAGASGGGSGGSFLPTPLILVLVLLALAAVTLGTVAIRRRRHS